MTMYTLNALRILIKCNHSYMYVLTEWYGWVHSTGEIVEKMLVQRVPVIEIV